FRAEGVWPETTADAAPPEARPAAAGLRSTARRTAAIFPLRRGHSTMDSVVASEAIDLGSTPGARTSFRRRRTRPEGVDDERRAPRRALTGRGIVIWLRLASDFLP